MAKKEIKNIPGAFGWSQGTVTPQPHVDVPEGLYEEEFGRNGFFGRTAHLYHRHPPTGWLKIEGPLKPRAYDAHKIPARPRGEPEFFLENSDVRIGMAKLVVGDDAFFVRNGDGDEVRFIHTGAGQVQTDFGDLDYTAGDYIVIPRGTTCRWIAREVSTQLVIESASQMDLPDRGMLGRHAQFDPMVMRTPVLHAEERSGKSGGQNAEGVYRLWIQREQQWTQVDYPFSPINAAGWKGDLAPWAIHVSEIRPVVSPRYHLPPSVHTTFLGRGFVICSFLPRPLESEEGAMKVPFYHRNIDFDEVLFYHAGNFFSREGISAGAVTFHPQGIHHGPHPNAAKNAADKTETQEIAVMIDTQLPLHPTAAAERVEYKDYAMSWRADQGR